MNRVRLVIIIVTAAIAAQSAMAQIGGGFDLTWSTLSAGGTSMSMAGDLVLSGAIGQSSAADSTGSGFDLHSGFLAVSNPTCSTCLGDMNGDALKNGMDIQSFTSCFLADPFASSCGCSDLNDDGVVDLLDVDAFVQGLLTGPGSCL